MELRFLAGAFRRSRVVIVVLALFGLAAGAALGLIASKTYASRASLVVNPNNISSLVNANAAPDQATYVSTQVGVVESSSVLSVAATRVPGQTLRSLQRSVQVTQRGTSNIIDIVATTHSPTRSAAIANAVAGVYQSQAQGQVQALLQQTANSLQSQLSNLQNQINASAKSGDVTSLQSQYTSVAQSLDQVNLSIGLSSNAVTIIDKATPPPSPRARHTETKAAIGLLAGLVVGLLVAVLRAIIRPRLLTAVDVEDAFGLPVVARLPSLHGSPAAGSDELERELMKACTYLEGVKGSDERVTVLVTSAEVRAGVSVVSGLLTDVLNDTGYRAELVSLNGQGPGDDRVVPSMSILRRKELFARWLQSADSSSNMMLFDGGSLADSPAAMTLCRSVDVIVLVVPLPSADERAITGLLRSILGPVLAQLIIVTNKPARGRSMEGAPREVV